MIPWKHRLYAFLLRRVLGPILDTDSLQQLHSLLDVSFTDGRCTLRNVSFRTDHETLATLPLRVRKATVRELTVHLRFQEDASNDHAAWETVRTAWGTALPRIALAAKIELDGVFLELEPQVPASATTIPVAPSAATQSLLSLYLDAALKSLELSVEIRDISIRCWENDEEGVKQAWVEMRCQSFSYQTAAVGKSTEGTPLYETKFHKTVLFQKTSLCIGEVLREGNSKRDAYRASMVLLEGVNRITLRVIEYSSNACDSVSASTGNRTETDCEVNLSQKLNISIDTTSLLLLRKFVHTYSVHFRQNDRREVETLSQSEVESNYEAEDLDFLNTMMEQYRAAREQVERNELRNGVLVPDFSQNGSKDEVSFDMFFDANETSFYQYSAMLHDSIALSRNESPQHSGALIATIRFHIAEIGLKIVFSNDGEHSGRRDEAYALASVKDIDCTSSIFANSQEHVLVIGNFGVDDSLISKVHSQVSRKVEIRPIFTFLCGSDGLRERNEEILVQSPCISLNVRKRCQGELDIDLEMLPLVYECDLHTLPRMSKFAAAIQNIEAIESEGEEESLKQETEGASLRISISCPSVHFKLPILKAGNWENSFERSVYEVVSCNANNTYVGIDAKNVLIAVNCKQVATDEDLSLRFDDAIAFVSFPNNAKSAGHYCRRFDILTTAGRSEVQPTIPVNIKLWRECIEISNEEGQRCQSRGQIEFPMVPPISSFKHRQEDEDDDARIDRVLCSKLGGVDPRSRSRIRQVGAQQEMLENAAKSNTVISIQIPEFVGDVTSTELSTLLSIFRCISKPETSVAGPDSGNNRKCRAGLHSTSLLVSVTSTTLGVHDDTIAHASLSQSFVIMGHGLKLHGVVCGNDLIQGRLLVQDVNFVEVGKLVKQKINDRSGCIRRRAYLLRKRLSLTQDSLTRSIFHRSKLFKPISPASPCVLLDFSLPERTDSNNDMLETHFQITLYDMTLRIDYESRHWPTKLRAIFVSASGNSTSTMHNESGHPSSTGASLSRIGISLADCNVDYVSPVKFRTPSRVIVRLGDLRFSTNMLLPRGPSQSFSVTLCDVSIYLCNSRFPYNYENSSMLGGTTLFQSWQTSLDAWKSQVKAEISPDDVQRKMNFRTLLTLSSLDAVISLSNHTRKTSTESSTTVSLTIGELALFCCRDSFSILLTTIGEMSRELSAIDDEALRTLKSLNSLGDDEVFLDSVTELDNDDDGRELSTPMLSLLKQQSVLRPQIGTDSRHDRSKDFLLDGYDWTTIDADFLVNDIPAGEEQSARWFTAPFIENDERTVILQSKSTTSKIPPIINHHFRLQPVSDPLGEGDMGASKYSGNSSQCYVKSRILIHDFALKIRCFDGYDWPEMLDEKLRSIATCSPFVVGSTSPKDRSEKEVELSDATFKRPSSDRNRDSEKETRIKLMSTLLDDKANSSAIFNDLPLPEDRTKKLKDQSDIRRLSRRTNKYIQISVSGTQLRLDSFEDSTDHRLASCLDMKIGDFFVAETISKDRPTKMIGEWVNDEEHPRNTNDGLGAIKMVSWHPAVRVTPENDVVNDEAEFALKLLPLRCSLDQRAIRFALAFFNPGDDCDADKADEPLPEGLHALPPPLFKTFRVRPLKVKVDYKPEKINTDALKNGAVVELVNLSPLDGMVVTLQEVIVNNEVGFGPNISILLRQYIQDVCATQLHKFVTHAAPFQPITHVGGSAIDLVALPWEALQNGESIGRAFRAGTTSFTNAVSYETFTLSSRMTEFFASTVASLTSPRHAVLNTGGFSCTLPSRPIHIPRTLNDASQHALESLSRGLQTANYRIVIVPYREYHRSGAAGAGSSLIRGIPVAIAAPASGVAEAISFSLLAIRNQLRPDILREEEASLRGLLLDDDR